MDAKNAISWFEIPAMDLARATRFYESVLARKLNQETMGPYKLSVFAYEQPGVGGCLITGDASIPAQNGTLVYLSVDNLDGALERTGRAGGKIVLSKTALPEGLGFFAHIIDSEGNRVGLHALQ
jgi:predicted enzyme related to lactoylglutathione lyase